MSNWPLKWVRGRGAQSNKRQTAWTIPATHSITQEAEEQDGGVWVLMAVAFVGVCFGLATLLRSAVGRARLLLSYERASYASGLL